jgi:type II restriction enzyme
MRLEMACEIAAAYTSGAQRARVVTESWGESNLYCPNCSSPKLTWLEPGHPASDYSCPKCNFWFQLKSQKSRIGNQITDGAYRAMMNAIRHDETPNFYFMQYELATWRVKNLLLVPSFAFPPSAIIKRPPLSSTARRAGWVGCNIALNRVPVEARISVVTDSEVLSEKEVREQFRRVKPLKDISVTQRGWTLDVLNIVRRLVNSEGRAPRDPNSGKMGARITRPSDSFTTADVYAFTRELEKLHPDNRHVKDKIRQQLQVLRDLGLLLHIERGIWRLP